MSRLKLFFLMLIPFWIGLWMSTQSFAEKIQYDPSFLGNAWYSSTSGEVITYGLYAPWKFITWWRMYYSYVPDLFMSSSIPFVFGLFLCIALLVCFAPKKQLSSHGTARWAEYGDLLKMDLISSHGVVVGLYDTPWKQFFTSILRSLENIKKEKESYAELDYDQNKMKKIDKIESAISALQGKLNNVEVDLEEIDSQLSDEEISSAKKETLLVQKKNKTEQQKKFTELIKVHNNQIANFPKYDAKTHDKFTVYYPYIWPYKKFSSFYKKLSHFYLRDNSNKHLAVVAPTRSGKGVGLIVPTLLGGWNESCIVNDIKSENWGITAGYRKKMGQKVIKFEPTSSDGSSARWNPLDEIPVGDPLEVSMAQNLAAVIADFEGKGKPDHWVANASNVIMAAILHLKYAHLSQPEKYPTPPNLYTVAAFLKANTNDKPTASADDPAAREAQAAEIAKKVAAGEVVDVTAESKDKAKDGSKDKKDKDILGFVDTIKGLVDYQHVPDTGITIKTWSNEKKRFVERVFKPDDLMKLYPDAPSLRNPKYRNTHPIILQAFMEISAKPADELGSIVSTANTALKEYLDPVLAANTAVSDFCIDDLMNYRQPVSLYLVTPPSDLLRLSPIFRLFFEMMVRHHARFIGEYKNGQAKSVYKHKCLFLMDEFSSLGNLQSFAATLSYIAGYGMKVFLINQGMPQINGIYGKDNQILMNCHLKIWYAPNDNDSAKEAESMLGNQTIIVESRSDNSNGGLFARKSVSRSETARALMTADELKRMGDKEIICATGFPSVFTDKIKYYENNFFLKKLCDAPVVSDVIRPVTRESYPARFAKLDKAKEKIRENRQKAMQDKIRQEAALNEKIQKRMQEISKDDINKESYTIDEARWKEDFTEDRKAVSKKSDNANELEKYGNFDINGSQKDSSKDKAKVNTTAEKITINPEVTQSTENNKISSNEQVNATAPKEEIDNAERDTKENNS